MAKKKKGGSLIGSWAFLIGVVLAIIAGFIGTDQSWIVWTLVIVGILVGLFNITAHEAMGFLTASAILVIVTALSSDIGSTPGGIFGPIPFMGDILSALMIVFVPATIIVALRAVFSLAQN